MNVGSTTLEKILSSKHHTGVAKNVIVFVGDGMGIPTVTMARIFQGQMKNTRGERNTLSFEKFPFVGLSKVEIILLTHFLNGLFIQCVPSPESLKS